MQDIILIPDSKLRSKNFLILFTISVVIIIAALILQITIPLGKGITAADLSVILWPVTAAVIALLWLISAPIIHLWVKNLKYFIEEERIVIHKGILTKIEQNIPYRAITDFMLHRSLYDRFFGIGSVRIQTAGQSATPTGYEANMGGLKEWNDIIKEMRARVKEFKAEQGPVADVDRDQLPTDGILKEILHELKAIREELKSRRNS